MVVQQVTDGLASNPFRIIQAINKIGPDATIVENTSASMGKVAQVIGPDKIIMDTGYFAANELLGPVRVEVVYYSTVAGANKLHMEIWRKHPNGYEEIIAHNYTGWNADIAPYFGMNFGRALYSQNYQYRYVIKSYTGVTAPILAAALTGATNGLHASGRNVGLGGTLTGNTTIETSTATLKLGSAGRNIVIEATGGANGSILIGECTMTSNYIYTDSTETVIDSGAGKMCMCSNNIAVNGTHFKYDSHPTVWTGATQIVDVAYVTGRTAGATTYNCASPSTTLVGGMGPGTSLTGRGLDDILQEILVPYLLPAFSGFGIVGLPPIIEIGCVIPISTSCQFTWGFTNSGNVQAATMCVRDTTAGATLATNISTSAPQSVNITPTAPLSFTTYGQSQSWCGSAKNTHATQFGSVNNTVHSYYPYYWGKCTCPFPSGVNRPVPDSAMVAGGTKVLAPSGGAISINFNTGADDYLWFAIPSTVVATKTAYYIPALGVGGTIGGGIGAGCNLFPAPVPAITVTTACWIKTYDVYISNKQSQGSNAMTIS